MRDAGITMLNAMDNADMLHLQEFLVVESQLEHICVICH